MPAFDAHVQALQDNLTELSSLDRLNRIKEDWLAYVTGIEEMKLHHKTLGRKIITRVLGQLSQKESPITGTLTPVAPLSAQPLYHFVVPKE